jgi:hypothetical protein
MDAPISQADRDARVRAAKVRFLEELLSAGLSNATATAVVEEMSGGCFVLAHLAHAVNQALVDMLEIAGTP